jgi:hypothetical protein
MLSVKQITSSTNFIKTDILGIKQQKKRPSQKESKQSPNDRLPKNFKKVVLEQLREIFILLLGITLEKLLNFISPKSAPKANSKSCEENVTEISQSRVDSKSRQIQLTSPSETKPVDFVGYWDEVPESTEVISPNQSNPVSSQIAPEQAKNNNFAIKTDEGALFQLKILVSEFLKFVGETLLDKKAKKLADKIQKLLSKARSINWNKVLKHFAKFVSLPALKPWAKVDEMIKNLIKFVTKFSYQVKFSGTK